jgi:hypothetical protein
MLSYNWTLRIPRVVLATVLSGDGPGSGKRCAIVRGEPDIERFGAARDMGSTVGCGSEGPDSRRFKSGGVDQPFPQP